MVISSVPMQKMAIIEISNTLVAMICRIAKLIQLLFLLIFQTITAPNRKGGQIKTVQNQSKNIIPKQVFSTM